MKEFPRNFSFPHRFLSLVGPRRLSRNFPPSFLALAILAYGTLCPAQPPAANNSATNVANILSLRIVQEQDGPAVEILSSKPLVPAIQALTNPDRLVIDLAHAQLDASRKISVDADQISALRANQFQNDPPIVRIVVDLLAPRAYTWDAAGNRLVVHLGKNPGQAITSPFQLPTVPTLASAPQPIVAAIRAAGPLSLSGNSLAKGSVITASSDTSVLSLSSGGEIHVCPGTTLSVTPSQNRHNLMLSLNTGALEAHFGLDASTDTVVTPDFRIQLVGPGEFHYAFSADNQGNTCVRALPGNTASALVTELMGDRTYQVKATDQLVFRAGQLDRVDMAVPLECGCPPPREAPEFAANTLPTQPQSQTQPPQLKANGSPDAGTKTAATPTGIPAPAPLAASLAPNELHVKIEAPFVFQATGPPPLPAETVKDLPPAWRPLATPASAAPLPPSVAEAPQSATTEPASANRKPPRGFFKKVGGFFASLFH